MRHEILNDSRCVECYSPFSGRTHTSCGLPGSNASHSFCSPLLFLARQAEARRAGARRAGTTSGGATSGRDERVRRAGATSGRDERARRAANGREERLRIEKLIACQKCDSVWWARSNSKDSLSTHLRRRRRCCYLHCRCYSERRRRRHRRRCCLHGRRRQPRSPPPRYSRRPLDAASSSVPLSSPS